MRLNVRLDGALARLVVNVVVPPLPLGLGRQALAKLQQQQPPGTAFKGKEVCCWEQDSCLLVLGLPARGRRGGVTSPIYHAALTFMVQGAGGCSPRKHQVSTPTPLPEH